MLRIARAHDYRLVEAVRHELSRLPPAWWSAASFMPWYLLPVGLSPLWIGLMAEEDLTHDGRRYSESGGWCARLPHPNWRDTPHIYLDSEHAWAAVHEVAHALEFVWDAPVDALYQPARAFHDYMASNPSEYFAVALDAFCQPERDDRLFNRLDLARHDPAISAYLTSRLTAASDLAE